MPIAIVDEHVELEDIARRFLYKSGARGAARDLLDSPTEEVPAFWPDLVDLGWLGLHLPADVGGSDGGIPELVIVLQELGRAIAPGPFLPTVLASAIIDRRGTGDQRARWLPGLADGTTIGAVALHGATLDPQAQTISAPEQVVLGAGFADILLVVTGDDIVVVDATEPGVTISDGGNLDLTRRAAKVTVDAVMATDDRRLYGAARQARALAWTFIAAEATGGAQECVNTAVEYAKTRQQFGRPIGMFQAVKHHCADMLVAAELATAAVWDAARAASDGDDQFDLAAAVAATEAVDAFYANAKTHMQVHGGIGFTWEHDSHMLLRRASTLRLLADPQSAARRVLELRAEGVKRRLGVTLPPEAEAIRADTRRAAEEIAALPASEQRTRLIDTGYVQPHWPRPWGREAKALEQLVIDEEFKRAGISRPSYGITGWVILTLIQHGTEDQVERWVRPTLQGDMVWCQLFSEPDAGSDAAAVRTRATRVDGGFLINGQKVWTSGAQSSHRGLATVRTDPDKAKHDGITTVVIDMHAPGVDVRPLREASGASLFNEVFFTDVFVPDDDVVGPVDGGWAVARSTLGNERVSIGGGGGMPTGMLDLVAIRTGPFCTAGETLDADLGRHEAHGQTMKVLNLRAAQRALAGGEPGPEGNVTKLLSAEDMQRGADLALELLGPKVAVLDGPGFLAAQILIFSRAMTIAGGTSEITRNQIGERILGLPRDPLIR